jgi:hypothetical protein
MNGKYTILPVFYSNEVNIGSMGSEILRRTVIQRRVAVSLYRGGRLFIATSL